jgi:diphthamide biosynthesis protein 2
MMQVYVLADTTYNPLSIDEVAAQHVNADCVVRSVAALCKHCTSVPRAFEQLRAVELERPGKFVVMPAP